MARQFNVLDYISTSELGLSRVIADLLNPNAAHGQGVLFLDLLLGGLKRSSERGQRPLDLTKSYGDWAIEAKNVRVETERAIAVETKRGSLDVCVEIGVGDDTRCLVLENKPYARDGFRQIEKYLDHLEHSYGDGQDGAARHCLIYLPGTGRMPAEWSVDRQRLDKERPERDFAVMPYCRAVPGVESEGEDASFLLDYALADWFRECRRACDVDRLRWFLGDAETFCERRFGENVMTDTAWDQINEFLMQPDQLYLVREVCERWPDIRSRVIKRFGDRLKERVKKELGPDVRCEHTLHEHKLPKLSTGISVYRADWCLGDQTVEIRAEAYLAGATSWDIGVVTRALKEAGEGSRQETCGALAGRLAADDVLGPAASDDEWPWWKSVDDSWKLWSDDVVVELATEGGSAEEYFVGRFCEIFEAAKDSIDNAVAEARERGGSPQ